MKHQPFALNPRKRRGVTLIEVIVVLAISSIVIALAVSILTMGQRVFQKGSLQSNKQSDIRIAMDYIQNQVQFATFIEATNDADDHGAVLNYRERIYLDNGYLVHDKWNSGTSAYDVTFRSIFQLASTNFSQLGNQLDIFVQDTNRTQSEYELNSKIKLPNIVNSGQIATAMNIVKFTRGVDSIGLVSGGGGGLITGVDITQTSVTIEEGHYLRLVATVSKTGFPEDQSVNWTSSDSLVAPVDTSGRIYGESVPTPSRQITITATSNADPTKFDTCLVTVIPAASTDTTPPIASVTTATLYRGQDVTTALSSEDGTIYLVSSGVTPPSTKAELDAAVTANNARSVSAIANTATTISTVGLGPIGTYYAYAIDEAFNVSARSAGVITLKSHGPIGTFSSGDHDSVKIAYDQNIASFSALTSSKNDVKYKLIAAISADNRSVTISYIKIKNGSPQDIEDNAVISITVTSFDGGITTSKVTHIKSSKWSAVTNTPS